MNDILAKNIARYRKTRRWTQDDLARKLGLSPQAVSKWETGQSCPDIALLGDLAAWLETDVNSLLGYPHSGKRVSFYEEEYRRTGFYWGLVPSRMCYRVMELLPPTKPLRLLDVGCGEGKDAVFFARNGYRVTAFDVAEAGLEKARRLAEANNVELDLFRANLLDYRLDEEFDVIFSSGVFHYIPPDLRREILLNYQEHTAPDGLHALNVFVKKPFIEEAPEKEPSAALWKSGELAMLYADWLLESMSEVIFDCNSSDVPHKHCMDVLIARKIAASDCPAPPQAFSRSWTKRAKPSKV